MATRLIATPYVLYGTLDQLRDQLIERRDRLVKPNRDVFWLHYPNQTFDQRSQFRESISAQASRRANAPHPGADRAYAGARRARNVAIG